MEEEEKCRQLGAQLRVSSSLARTSLGVAHGHGHLLIALVGGGWPAPDGDFGLDREEHEVEDRKRWRDEG
jgi:hypothetical protein